MHFKECEHYHKPKCNNTIKREKKIKANMLCQLFQTRILYKNIVLNAPSCVCGAWNVYIKKKTVVTVALLRKINDI